MAIQNVALVELQRFAKRELELKCQLVEAHKELLKFSKHVPGMITALNDHGSCLCRPCVEHADRGCVQVIHQTVVAKGETQ